ncbi:PAS domain-containing protein [Chloroflexota bacterium]
MATSDIVDYCQLIAEYSDDLIWVMDKNLKIIYMTPSVEKHSGFTVDEVLNLPMERLYPPESIEVIMSSFKKEKARNTRGNRAKPQLLQLKAYNKDGTIGWIEAQVSIVRDEKGDIDCVIGITRNITKRKHIEEELKKTVDLLVTTQSIGKIGSWEIDLISDTAYWSDEVYRMFGLKPQEIEATPKALANYVHPDDREMVIETFNNSLKSGASYDIVHRLMLKDGTIKDVSVRCMTYYDNGAPIRSIGIVQDITARKWAEEALSKSEKKYRNLFETMAQGVVYQDASGNILSANPSAERILGLSIDEMQGRTSIDPRWRSIHEDGADFPGETHPAMVALKTGKRVNNVIMGVFSPRDSQMHWININAVPQFKQGEKKPYQVYTTFEDITERKLAEDKIRAYSVKE